MFHQRRSILVSIPKTISLAVSGPVFQVNLAKRVVSVHLALLGSEGSVGEPLRSQIVVTSTARPSSNAITLSSLYVQFKGSLNEVRLTHEAKDDVSSSFFDCTLQESSVPPEKPKWTGTADLTLHPGQTKVYNFPLIFREAGDVEATAYTFEIDTERFSLICSNTDLQTEPHSTWWMRAESGVKPRKVKRLSGITTHILPKPPKMEIRLPDVREQYFTDESVTLAIEISNQEEEETEAVLEVRLLGRSKDTLAYTWVDRPASSPMKEVPPALDGSTDVDLPGHVVGRLPQGRSTTEKICFTAPADPADYALEVKVLYHLLSDRETPISRIMIADLVFNSPFEASYDLNARVHPDPWPSYFDLQEAESNSSSDSPDAFGIAQKWGLRAKVASFADEQLIVKDLTIQMHSIHGGATCEATKEFSPTDTTMNLQELHDWSFSLDIQKNNLEERRSTALDTTLDITWQRVSSQDDEPIVSSLPIPRIQIPSSEPRVLASALSSITVPDLLHLDYTLENPTMHFLTFEFNMEASEEFGFSGPKLRVVHLLPMSRQTVRYNILPVQRGLWISPGLKVVDRYFNKTLRVQATEGLRMEKGRVEVWVPGEAEQ
jgi:hypothetical protein